MKPVDDFTASSCRIFSSPAEHKQVFIKMGDAVLASSFVERSAMKPELSCKKPA
jgi:hypothetical protein